MHHDNKLLVEKGMRLGCMTMDTFRSVVAGLRKFSSRLKFITLQSRGESLLNKDILEMTRILKKANVAEKIGLYTNGALLSHRMADGLIDAGLDVLHISIEGMDDEQYRKIANVEVDFAGLVEQIAYFYHHKKECYLYVKTMDNDMGEADRKKFLETFGEISDDLFIERPVNAWQDAGIDKSLLKKDRYIMGGDKVAICPRIFFALVVHFDGNVVACDHDWKEEYVVGNVHEEVLPDIWQGVAMERLRERHIFGQADFIERCRECVQRTECLPQDNVDDLLQIS